MSNWCCVVRCGAMWCCVFHSPWQMYAKKIGGQEWIDVLQRMMAEFVQLIVEPALQVNARGQLGSGPARKQELGRWVPCETLVPS